MIRPEDDEDDEGSSTDDSSSDCDSVQSAQQQFHTKGSRRVDKFRSKVVMSAPLSPPTRDGFILSAPILSAPRLYVRARHEYTRIQVEYA